MATKGVIVIDFGAHPGKNEATVTVTGQAAILATSVAEAYVMEEATADHTANDHAYFNNLATLTCGTPTAANGFPIKAVSEEMLQGTFNLRWIWD